jgi:LysR family transcriptional regulator (chromosome initiation inhibitor)
MSRFDYKLLHALHMVMQEQSFERAARALYISQSAVSQRIKQLEEFVAHPVIVRGQPIVATSMGQKLLSHYKQVKQLEDVLLPDLLPDAPTQSVKLSLAVNADSVATWFFDVMTPLLKSYPIELDLLIANETRTLDKLRSGEAFAAVSLNQQVLPGFAAFELGKMKYILVATPQFQQRYFANGINAQSLRQAPGVSFDPKDDMHIRFIEKHFGLSAGSYPRHTVRSSEAFVEITKQGAAYCLLSELQIEKELASGELINILPEKSLTQVYYWHCWVMVRGVYKAVSQQIVKGARQILTQNQSE